MEDTLKSSITPNDSTVPVDNSVRGDDGVIVSDNGSNPEDLDSMWLRWKCLSCGFVYEGVEELKKCPKCGNENPDLFGDVD